MPHNFLKSFKTNIADYAIVVLGKVQALLIQQVQKVVLEIIEELKNNCPPVDRLQTLTKKVDNVRLVVAGARNKIEKVASLGDYLDPVLLGAKIYLDFQYHLRPDFVSSPVTLTAGTPTLSKKQTQINNTVSKLRRFEDLIETVEDAQSAIKIATASTNAILIPILSALDLIQSFIDRCLTNQEIPDKDLEGIIQATNQIYINGIQYKNIKGTTYTIKVIKDPSSPAVAQKRQAIAQNFRGITVLTGPSSFAGDPQVLVEELKFRIDKQLP